MTIIALENKNAFINWIANDTNIVIPKISDKIIGSAFTDIGLKDFDLFSESDLSVLQLNLNKLILFRENCKSINSEEYISVVLIVTSYIEFVKSSKAELCAEKQNKENDKLSSISNDYGYSDRKNSTKKKEPFVKPSKELSDDSLTLALYLSSRNDIALKELGYKNQREAFIKIAEILGRKSSTIKNMRDEFDPYFDNGRVGWNKRELVGSRKEIFDKYKNASDSEMAEIVHNILDKYSTVDKAPKPYNTGKIHISTASGSMKEITMKKKK